MRKLLIVILICYSSFLASQTKLFYLPKWEYIEVDGTQIIYDKSYEQRAKLVASFLTFIVKEEPEMKNLLKSDRIIIDASFMSDNLNFDFYSFVENNFLKENHSKLDYDPITLNNLQQLTDIPLSLDFNIFKKDFLQYTYNLTRGTSLQGAKKVLYPDWFENPSENGQTLDLLNAFERRIELNAYDNYRDFAINNRNFTTNQLLNSSYLRKQPDPIYLGILAQDYFMIEFGLDNWEKIVKDVEYFDKIFFPYSSAFKKHTGLTLSQFYRDSHAYYQEIFQNDVASLPPDVSKPFFAEDIIIKNRSYSHPHFLSNNEVIAVYSSFEESPTIIKIDTLHQIKKLTKMGFTNSENVDVNEPYVLWNQNFAYPNFNNFNYSRIAVYNLENNKTSYLGNNKLYLKPTLSPQQDILSVVSYNDNFEQEILLLDFPTGNPLYSLANPNCYSFHDLTWLDQNILIYIAENFLGQTAIYKFNLTSKLQERITPYSIDPIKDLIVENGLIYFSYPVNNIYNICSLALDDSLAYQTFYSEVSAGQPTIKGNRMILTSNRYWGKQLRIIDLEKEFWTPILWNDYDDLSKECSAILSLENNDNLTTNKLNPFYKLINFKRLRLSYDQKEVFIYSVSQNPMRTFTIHAKTQFNFTNQGVKTTISNIMSKHYPNILSEISHANSNFSSDKFEEITYGSSIKLPYYFSTGKYAGYVNLNLGIYHLDRYKSRRILNFIDGADLKLNYLKTDLSFNYSKVRAKNHFYSPFGQNYLLSYKKSIDNRYAQQFYAMADYSLPGFRNSDSILLENSFLAENSTNRYLFGNMINSLYGYDDWHQSDRIYKTSFKYYLPLFYPEKGIDNVIFLKRIYTALLAGYSKSALSSDNMTTYHEQNTLGNELIFDYNLLDSIEFKLGFRYTHAFNRGHKHQFDLFIPFTKF
ncbi:hypothetical protein JEZ13_10080 [bacterium]|nr:hypothetical protein [bacterium]